MSVNAGAGFAPVPECAMKQAARAGRADKNQDRQWLKKTRA